MLKRFIVNPLRAALREIEQEKRADGAGKQAVLLAERRRKDAEAQAVAKCEVERRDEEAYRAILKRLGE